MKDGRAVRFRMGLLGRFWMEARGHDIYIFVDIDRQITEQQ